VRRFPLKQGPESPTDFLAVMFKEGSPPFRSQAIVLDGNGEALAVSHVGDWDSLELEEFIAAAGLNQRVELLPAPMNNLREDGLILEDGTWFQRVPAAGTLTLIVSLLTGSGVIPAALGWVIVLALAGYVLAAFTSGAFSKGRRGKGAAQEEAYIATGDSSVFDQPPSNPNAEPPEPAT
jgi:hypothetical protein